jgi:hypothetical protein
VVTSLVLNPPSTQVEPPSGAGSEQAEEGPGPPGVDLAQLAQIGQMVAEAARSGNFQVQQGEPPALDLSGAQTIDLRGSGLREEIVGILEAHGIDPDPASPQEVDASTMPEMQRQILDAIARQGVDLRHGGPPSSGEDP